MRGSFALIKSLTEKVHPMLVLSSWHWKTAISMYQFITFFPWNIVTEFICNLVKYLEGLSFSMDIIISIGISCCVSCHFPYLCHLCSQTFFHVFFPSFSQPASPLLPSTSSSSIIQYELTCALIKIYDFIDVHIM